MKAAIVLSRMDSTRLPRKALRPLGSSPLIMHMLKRASLLEVDLVILATSDRAIDDEYSDLISLANRQTKKPVVLHRSEYEDCVARVSNALNQYSVSRFCRINGDCPFFPISIYNEYITDTRYCFVNNIRKRNFPYGLSVEILDSDFYLASSRNVPVKLREHTTAHLYKQHVFDREHNITPLLSPKAPFQRSTRFVIDTQDDYQYWCDQVRTHELKYDSELLV